MNIRKGLLRAWLVLSLLWLMLVGVLSYGPISGSLAERYVLVPFNESQQCEGVTPDTAAGCPGAIVETTDTDTIHARFTASVVPLAILAVAPPVILLLVGTLVVWIGQGFSDRQPRTERPAPTVPRRAWLWPLLGFVLIFTTTLLKVGGDTNWQFDPALGLARAAGGGTSGAIAGAVAAWLSSRRSRIDKNRGTPSV
jgi:hypothetical protein